MSDSSESEYDTEDDEDYIPVEPSSEEDIEQETSKKRKMKKKSPARRKRKRGIKLDEEDEISSPGDSEEEDVVEDDATGEVEDDKKDDLASEQRVDKLWEAFKQDTAAVRPATSSSIKQNIEKKVDKKQEGQDLSSSKTKKEEKEVPKKFEVTEIFDFAGEEVKVVKSVDASSIKPAASGDEDKNTLKPKTALPIKRPGGGLGSILGKIGKKPKLSTLEKSKLDWNSFKKEEGIEDELKMSNRDGYLEKQAFLSRVDHKQFEIERDVRQAMRKK